MARVGTHSAHHPTRCRPFGTAQLARHGATRPTWHRCTTRRRPSNTAYVRRQQDAERRTRRSTVPVGSRVSVQYIAVHRQPHAATLSHTRTMPVDRSMFIHPQPIVAAVALCVFCATTARTMSSQPRAASVVSETRVASNRPSPTAQPLVAPAQRKAACDTSRHPRTLGTAARGACLCSRHAASRGTTWHGSAPWTRPAPSARAQSSPHVAQRPAVRPVGRHREQLALTHDAVSVHVRFIRRSAPATAPAMAQRHAMPTPLQRHGAPGSRRRSTYRVAGPRTLYART